MITLRPVVELPGRRPDRWLTLHGACPPEEVEAFVEALVAYLDVEAPAGPRDAVAALLREEMLIVAGGLRLHDSATGATVSPGCCAGLEDWRQWADVLTGGAPWLGHDPWPEITPHGDLLRVWQHGGAERRGPYVDLTRAELARLLLGAQADLVGFLGRLDRWAYDVGATAAALVAAVDRDFAVTAPLALPEEGSTTST
ncbi:hypothetical protein [Micromonospora auratinigra]|uniref:Uncharacterized protein n=1 Tax=Micromonospora auratinigra TaxID=261654 RepID=A0A1A8ZBY7_9ACTN|nr:hypothetical protein [Micromonospora auratinigra]SBT41388.1 hypothetical protein GA0070611_1602 [Micromonospora auratinigra]